MEHKKLSRKVRDLIAIHRGLKRNRRYGGPERRIHPRRSFQGLMKFYLDAQSLSDSLYNEVVNIKDISAGGLRFVSKVPIPQTSTLRIRINFFAGRIEIPCLARVAWTKAVNPRTGLWHEVGVSFIELQDQFRCMISDYVMRPYRAFR